MVSIGKDDAAALGAEAPRGRLQEPDHAEAQLPVAQRRLLFADAFGEVADDLLQRLARLDVRAPDVPGSIADQQLAAIIQACTQVDPAVVDLDRLGRVQLVEDQALPRPGEDHLADLDRREPVDVEVGQQPIVVVDIDVGHIFHVRVGVGASPSRDAPRLAAQDVVDD